MRETLKTTLLGGVVFLVPLVCVVVLIGKAQQIMKMLGGPLSNVIPVTDFVGIPVVEIVTAVLLFVCCLGAGLVAKSRLGRKFQHKLEATLLELVPGYAWIKGMTGDVSDDEARATYVPVLVEFDDQHQIGYLAENINTRYAAVYFPGAPNARSGSIAIVERARLADLNVGFGDINRLCKKLGRGSSDLLRNSFPEKTDRLV